MQCIWITKIKNIHTKKSNFQNPIFCKLMTYTPLIFQTWLIWTNTIYNFKYQSSTSGCKEIGFKQSEFVANGKNPIEMEFIHIIVKFQI